MSSGLSASAILCKFQNILNLNWLVVIELAKQVSSLNEVSH